MPAQNQRNNRIAFTVVGTALFMLGMSFAAVPLYKMFCQVTGFSGTPIIATSAPTTMGNKTLDVPFDANVSPELDWSFKPDVNSLPVRTGKTVTMFYKVTNNSSETQTAMAIYNVSPDQAGGFFNKISCFCFTDKTLGPGESMDMPVVFYLDPALEKDETMRNVAGVTLSYTFTRKKPRKTARATVPGIAQGAVQGAIKPGL